MRFVTIIGSYFKIPPIRANPEQSGGTKPSVQTSIPSPLAGEGKGEGYGGRGVAEVVKITKISPSKSSRPVAAFMAAQAFLFLNREAPCTQKIRFIFSCLLFTASCLLFLSPAPTSASTYQDVQKFLNDNPAPSDCVNWMEEVGSGYKVWRRCNAGNYYVIITIDYAGGSGCYNCNMQQPEAVSCEYTRTTQKISCDGNTIVSVNSIRAQPCEQRGVWSCAMEYACPYNLDNSANCRSYDLLLAEFTVDQCLNKLTNTYESCAQNCKDPVNKTTTTAVEICGDGIDNNCNGQIDEGCEPEEVKKNLGSGNDKPNPPTECGFSIANFSTGNLYKDYTIPLGFSDLVLSYNSLDSFTGPLGKGRTHTYTITLSYISNASLILAEGDGKRVKYISSDGITYIPEEKFGDASTITKTPDNTFFLRKKNGTVWTFSSDGRPASITDRNNNITTLTYTNGELTSITDPYARTVTLAYTSGKLTSIKDPLLREYTLSYTGDLLTSITDPEAGKTIYTYDANNRILSVQGPNSAVTAYAYDAQGRILSSQDPLGNTKSIQYLDTESKAIITDRNGNIATYIYDKDLNAIKQNIDPLGNITAYTYDTKGNLLTITHPDAATETYTYDTNNNPLTYTDRGGNTFTYTYEPIYNQITSIQDPLARKTIFTYDAKGNLTTITDPLNSATTLAYNTRGNLTSITNAMANAINITYDASGNISNIQDQLSNTTAFESDTIGNLKKIIDANANQTAYTYDNLNRLTLLTDALSHITAFTYSHTCSSCGTRNNLTSIKDAKLNTTNFEYNLNNKLTKETDPLNNTTAYTYDANGNLISKLAPEGLNQGIDANNSAITYTYDSLNRLIAKNYPDTTKTLFTYDTMGNLITATNQHITYTYTYDNNGRITSIADSFGRVISYQYDTVGNKIKMTAPDGKIINYTYDSNNRLTQITADVTQSFSFEYDALGRRTKLTHPNGINTTYTYDALSRLTGLTHKNPSGTVAIPFTFTYDNIGNKLTAQDPAGTYQYQYDTIYRLTAAQHTAIPTISKEAYTYDSVGNRLTDAWGRSYTYNNGNELLTQNGTTFTYDKNGNMTSKTDASGTTTYQYDYENRLIKATMPNGVVAQYKYDPFGRRIEKNITTTTTTKTTKYLYDREDILYELDANNNIITRYIHGPGIDEPLAMTKGGKTYYFHADALGSIRALTNTTAIPVQIYAYDTFGNIIAAPSGALSIQQPYTYTGREYDKETGLYYYRARYYDPKVGRFISKDPIGFAGGDVNLYVMVGGNPVNWVDPDGLFLYPITTAINYVIKPIVQKAIEDPAGQRIISAGISGAAGGAVVGAIGGASALGIGAVPGAIIGASIVAPINMLKQVIKEATGTQEVIDDVKDEIKKRIEENKRGKIHDWPRNRKDIGDCP